MTVEGGWAGVHMFFAGAHEDDFDHWQAVLRGFGPNWKTAGAFRNSDGSEENNPYVKLMARYPEIPDIVKEALSVQ